MALIYLSLLLFFFGYGGYLRYHAPKEVGKLFGYRSAKTTKSQRNWDTAQKVLSRYLYRLAILTVGIMVFSQFGPKLPDLVIHLFALVPVVLFVVGLLILPRQLPD